MQKKMSQRQIPTLLGVVVLAVALVVGVVALPQGFSTFAPRAAPESTPKNLKITNVRDTGFSVSFITDAATSGFVKYGTDSNNLRLQAADDRDQTTGQVGQYITHHITVRDLDPDKTYYFTAGTGGTPTFNNNGSPFTVKTAQRGGSPSSAKTIYGNIVGTNNVPVSGAIVYVNIAGAGELSTISKESGSWAIPLSTARTTDGSQYITVNKSDAVNISVVGPELGSSAASSLTVETAQPAAPISLTTGGSSALSTSTASSPTVAPTVAPSSTPESLLQADALASSPTPTGSPVATSIVSPSPSATLSATPTPAPTSTAEPKSPNETVEIGSSSPPTVLTSQPVITGNAAPNSTVSIVIHSETTITGQVQTDADGSFVFDVEQYAKDQHLEPGEHTVTITYFDTASNTNKTITQTFYVSPTGGVASATPSPSSAILALAASPTPFGSGNPYTIPSPTPTATPTPKLSPSPSPSPVATSSSLPRAGSGSTTAMLLIGGGALILLGCWRLLQVQPSTNRESTI